MPHWTPRLAGYHGVCLRSRAGTPPLGLHRQTSPRHYEPWKGKAFPREKKSKGLHPRGGERRKRNSDMGTQEGHVEQVLMIFRLLAGAILGAFDAWLVLRGLGGAGLRYGRQCDNAQALAAMLRDHPSVEAVRYPGLPDDVAHPVASTQMRRFGALVSVEFASAAAVHALVRRSELLVAATSFGGIHTSVDRRARWGDQFSAGFDRIALGIEDTDDLLADVERALATNP